MFHIQKIYRDLSKNGVLAITVPPLKYSIVGGHLSLWNAGMLIYHLIMAGFNCSKAAILQYDYNISVIVRKKAAALPPLDHDSGDIERLKDYFPFQVIEGFGGRIQRCRWPLVTKTPAKKIVSAFCRARQSIMTGKKLSIGVQYFY